MIPRRLVRSYCEALFLAACVCVALDWHAFSLKLFSVHPLLAGELAIAGFLTELLPVKIPRRGEEEQITLSSSFVMAILLSGGLAPALIVACGASVFQDMVARRPLWRARFNCGQIALALFAAALVLRAFHVYPHPGAHHPFSEGQLPIVLLSAISFFIVNTGLVGIAIASHQGISVFRYFRSGFDFVLITAGVLLVLAPIVVAAATYSSWMIPLMAAPILMIYNSLRQGERSEYAARHDPLTGLPNRVAFQQAMEEALSDEQRESALLLMDLDRFKEVNDTLGHHHGDLLLQEVASRLSGILRETEHLARLGGDEFALLLRRCSPAQALAVADRVSEALRPSFELHGALLDVQASVGIAMFPDHGREVEALMQKADVAMYRAKGLKTGAVIYEEQHDHHSRGRLTLAAELRSALERREIETYYQPALELASGTIRTVEALARWQHPERGLLSPQSFIQIAEETGLIKPLTTEVLAQSLAQVQRWSAQDLEVSVAVNISAAVLMQDGFAEQVERALYRARVPARLLKLEVTESALITQPQVTRGILQDLHELGVEILIDDFGTGYSSLAYLADLPASVVKIDRSFVAKMQVSEKDAIIVNSTIDLAHHLGMRAVAEGVEEPDLLAELRELGCDGAQGYVLSRPAPAEQITRFLRDWRGEANLEPAIATLA